jgi:hypothetical protein
VTVLKGVAIEEAVRPRHDRGHPIHGYSLRLYQAVSA